MRIKDYRTWLLNESDSGVDWHGLEAYFNSHHGPDCIPTNAREWKKFREQYEMLETWIPLEGEDLSSTMEKDYKRSIFEVFADCFLKPLKPWEREGDQAELLNVQKAFSQFGLSDFPLTVAKVNFLHALYYAIYHANLKPNKTSTFVGDSKWPSYSVLAKNSRNVNEDFSAIQAAMDRMGWHKDKVGHVMNNQFEEIQTQYDEDAAETNGYSDIYMWHYNNEHMLAGEGVIDTAHEKIVKFGYGYHKTEYGKLMLTQHCGSVKNFVDAAPRYLVEALKNNEYDVLFGKYNNYLSATSKDDQITINFTDERQTQAFVSGDASALELDVISDVNNTVDVVPNQPYI